MFVLKTPPELLYTGLYKPIGKYREYEKNVADPIYFEKTEHEINIAIPFDETKEFRLLKKSQDPTKNGIKNNSPM